MEHYHIRWSSGHLDWERFSTRAEAEKSARRLVREWESYSIERYDDETCPKCSEPIERKPL